MPAFQPGNKKPEASGRKQGVKNQNKEVRSMLRQLVIDEFPTYVQKLHMLEDNEYCKNYKELLKYVIPTISAIKFDDSTDAKNATALLSKLMDYNEN